MILTGTIQKGYGLAMENLKKQLPYIEAEFPEIKGCFEGTLNLKIDRGLLVVSPDHRTKPIPWHESHIPGEIFDILRIKIKETRSDELIQAWLYIPHNSDHRKDLSIHEVIAQQLDVSQNDKFEIHIDRKCVELTYRQFPIVLVL